jgi:hypothetical protein
MYIVRYAEELARIPANITPKERNTNIAPANNPIL